MHLILVDATERFCDAITVLEDPVLRDYIDKSDPREPGAIAMCEPNYMYGRDSTVTYQQELDGVGGRAGARAVSQTF